MREREGKWGLGVGEREEGREREREREGEREGERERGRERKYNINSHLLQLLWKLEVT